MTKTISQRLLNSTAFIAIAALGMQAHAAVIIDGVTVSNSGALTGATGTTFGTDSGTDGTAGETTVTFSGANVTGNITGNVTAGTGGNGAANTTLGAPGAGNGGAGGVGANLSAQASPTLNVGSGFALTGGAGGVGGASSSAATAIVGGIGGAGGAGIVANGTTLNTINVNGTGTVVGGAGGAGGTSTTGTGGAGGAGAAGMTTSATTNLTFSGAGTVSGGAGGAGGVGNAGGNNGAVGATGAGIAVTGTGTTLTIAGHNGSIRGGSAGAGNAIAVTSGAINNIITNGSSTAGSTTGATIGGASHAGDAINLDAGGVTTAINNYGGGVIQASGGGSAIHVTAADTLTTLNNSGSIIAAGNAILIDATGNIGTINNSGTITGGTNAINNSGTALHLINTGTINGNVLLGNAGADIIDVNGGTIVGNIIGQGGNDTINFNAANFTTGGAITNMGAINVQSGIFNLSNNASGNTLFAVANGATANLNANLGATNVTNAGNLNLGAGTVLTGNLANNAGTVGLNGSSNITGTYTQASGATLATHITAPTTGSSVTTSGTASIANGGIIRANVDSGVNVTTGNFDILTSSALTTTPGNLVVTSNNAFLTFTPTVVASNTLRLSAAQATVAEASDHSLVNAGFTSAPGVADYNNFRTVAGGSTGGQNAVNTLTGYTGLMHTLQTTDFNSFTTINDRVGGLQGVDLTNALTSFQPTAAITTGIAQTSIVANDAAGNVMFGRLNSMRGKDGLSSGDATGHGLKVWLQPFVAGLQQDRKDGVDGFDADTYGILLGGDVSVARDFRLGVALGYDNTHIDATGASTGSNASVDGYQGSVYGTYAANRFYVDGLVGLKYNQYDTKRASLGTSARADFDGLQYSARAETGYDLNAGRLIVTPNASFNFSYLDTDSYTETGGFLNNHVNSNDNTSAMSELGVKFAYPLKTADATITPRVRTGWLHEFGDTQQTSTSNFVGGTQSFTVGGPDIDRDSFHIGGGVSYLLNNGTKLSADADYLVRDSSDAESAFLRLSLPL